MERWDMGTQDRRARGQGDTMSQAVGMEVGAWGLGAWAPGKRGDAACPADKYAIGFLPRENGVHSIDLRFNGRHVPGSPFNIRVGEQSQAGDPGLVTAYGPGLEGGLTGDAARGGGGRGSGHRGGRGCVQHHGWGRAVTGT